MTHGDTAQILVGHRDRMAKRVEQDGAGGLMANAWQRQQAAPKGFGWRSSERFERTSKLLVQHGYKCLERQRFAGIKAGGAYQIPQISEGQRAQAIEGQRSRLAQIGQRTLDGLPGCVLGQVSAEDDLKGNLGWPPVLGTVGLGQLIVHPAQALGGSGVVGCGHGWT